MAKKKDPASLNLINLPKMTDITKADISKFDTVINKPTEEEQEVINNFGPAHSALKANIERSAEAEKEDENGETLVLPKK